MKSLQGVGKTAIALLASAAAGLLLGICFYMLREVIGRRTPWGSESAEIRVLDAVQFGLISGAALFIFVFRKIRPL
jgi:hypothetical protein